MNNNLAPLKQLVEDTLRWIGKLEAGNASGYKTLVTSAATTICKQLSPICDHILKRHVVDDGQSGRITVVHYTSLRAVVSMLEDAVNDLARRVIVPPVHNANDSSGPAFRLYDSAHVNDPDEGQYLLRRLGRRYDWINGLASRHTYIASFIVPHRETKRPHRDGVEEPGRHNGALDNLSFWRAYGREGAGCSMSLSIPSKHAKRVCYGADSANAAIDQLDPLLALLDQLVQSTVRYPAVATVVRRDLAGGVLESLEPIRYLYKSRAYAYEKECRVVQPPPDKGKGVRFECRAPNGRRAHIRHYCEPEHLSLRSLLKSGTYIVIGPRVPESRSVQYCFETLLKKARLFGTEVRISDIRYQRF